MSAIYCSTLATPGNLHKLAAEVCAMLLSALLYPEHLNPTFFFCWTLGLLALMPLVAVVCKRSRTFASQPMVAAYDLTTLIPVVTLSWLGFRMLLGDPSVHEIPSRSSAFVEHTPELIMIQAAYQVFGTVAAVLIGPPLRTTTMIAHHVATGLTAWLSLQGHCMYYAIYFAGVVELTNIPLTFMDLCGCRHPARLLRAPCERSTPQLRNPPGRYFPVLEQRYPGVSTAARLSFALGFIALRVLGWLPAFVLYLRDLRDLAPDEPLVVGIMATTTVIITGLQMFWGYKVVRGLVDVILGGMRSGVRDSAGSKRE